MKSLILSFISTLLVFLPFLAEGQSSQSLFGGENLRLGVWGGGGLQYGPVAGDEAIFATGRIGLLLGSRLAVGGFYTTSLGEIYPDAETDANVYHDLRMGGLMVEYTLNPDKLVHVSFPLQLGWGEVQADWREGSPNYGDDDLFGEDSFFVIEPGAMLEVNLMPWARLQAGATYRLIPSGVEYRGLQAADLSGFAGMIGLRFGLFPTR